MSKYRPYKKNHEQYPRKEC